MLYKTRHFCPTIVLKFLYYSIFHSHVSFGLPVWGHASDTYIDKIVKSQKKAIRAITFSKYHKHSTPFFRKLEMLGDHSIITQSKAVDGCGRPNDALT